MVTIETEYRYSAEFLLSFFIIVVRSFDHSWSLLIVHFRASFRVSALIVIIAIITYYYLLLLLVLSVESVETGESGESGECVRVSVCVCLELHIHAHTHSEKKKKIGFAVMVTKEATQRNRQRNKEIS